MIERIGSEVTIERIHQAVADCEKERRTLDYKRDLNLLRSGDRAELAMDAASLANAAGGVLVFGVDECRDEEGRKTGEPSDIIGCPNFDDERRSQIENILRDLVKPPLPSHDIYVVPGGESGPVVLLRVLKSWAGPHMVKHKFYGRTSNGKYPLEVSEVRRAFSMAESRLTEIADFRDARLGQILGRATTYPLNEGPVAVFHVLPLASAIVDTSARELRALPTNIPLLHCRSPVQAELRPNVEGIVAARLSGGELAASVTQVFRTGGIETATTRFHATRSKEDGITSFSLPLMRGELVRVLDIVVAQAELFGLAFPVAMSLALHGFRGCIPAGLARHDIEDHSRRRWSIDRDSVVIGPQVANVQTATNGLLAPLMKSLWGAFGLHEGHDD